MWYFGPQNMGRPALSNRKKCQLGEWLVFDGALKEALMEEPQERWPGLMTQALQRSGNDLATAAERAFREGRIEEADRRRVKPLRRPRRRRPAVQSIPARRRRTGGEDRNRS